MNRRSFFRIFPGILAAKEIAEELAKPKPLNNGIWHQMHNPNRISYGGPLTKEMFEERMSNVFIKDPNRTLKIYTNKSGMEMFEKLRMDMEAKMLWG